MHKAIKAFLLILLLFFTSACRPQSLPGDPEPEAEPDLQNAPFANARAYEAEGFNILYPRNWTILSEEKVQGSATLRLQEQGNPAAQVVISFFPAVDVTKRDVLVEAENLLKGSLFRIQERLQTREERIGDRIIPVIHTRSGATETKVVQTAVILGEKGYLFATLILREEEEGYFVPIFRSMLEGIEVE